MLKPTVRAVLIAGAIAIPFQTYARQTPTTGPITQALTSAWADAKRNFRASADVMPEGAATNPAR